MLILHDAPGGLSKLSLTEIQSIIEKYNTWRGKLAASGKLVGGHKLMDEGGKALSKTAERLTVLDGPYSETKEIVGGYFIIRASSYDNAVQLASDCPHLSYGRIQLRKIDFLGHPET